MFNGQDLGTSSSSSSPHRIRARTPPQVPPQAPDEIFMAEIEASAFSSYEAKCDEFAAYCRPAKAHRLHSNTQENDILSRIDQIDAALVACVAIETLYKDVRKNYWMFPTVERGLRYALPDDNDHKLSPHLTASSLAAQQRASRYAKRKRIDGKPEPDPLKPLISAAIRKLAQKDISHLFEPFIKDDTPACKVGAFFVEKGGGPLPLLRTILDGRWSNLIFDLSDSKFSFFSLETLRQTVDNLSHHDTWYALNFDLRHWFHEIPLPKRYQKFFGIETTDRDNSKSTPGSPHGAGSFYFVPRAFPMGWSFSPLVAQCITWSLVLATKDRYPNPRHDLFVEQMRSHPEQPFNYLPLKKGGGIFVLLDNILVVTPDKDVANFWFDKITTNAKTYNAHLKYKEDPQSKKLPIDLLREQCFFTMTKNTATSPPASTPSDSLPSVSLPHSPPPSFEFLGIRWYHGHHTLLCKSEEDRTLPNSELGLSPPNVTDANDSQWHGTHRQLASVIGRIMWHRRVYNISFFDDDDNYGTAALRDIFAKLTPPEGVSWNDPLPEPLSVSLTLGLKKAWSARSRSIDSPPSELPSAAHVCPASCLLRPDNYSILWFATDAAKDDFNHQYAFVRYQGLLSPRPTIDMTALHPAEVKSGEYPRQYHIALGELHAIWKAVESVTDPNALIILATDSMNAKNWVQSGKAQCREAYPILKAIFTHLKKYNQRIYVVYVPSAQNVADYATRHTDKEFEDVPFRQTRCLLAHAETEACGLWLTTGGISGGKKED